MSKNTGSRLNLIDRLSQKFEAKDAETGLPLVEKAAELIESDIQDKDAGGPFNYNGGSQDMGEGIAAAPYEAVWDDSETSGFLELDLTKMRKAGYITPDGKRSRIKEQYRVIKRPLLVNAFQRAHEIANGHVIIVTSACPNEGKTFTATNLAMSIAAEREIKVLLMDADVVRQDLSRRFGIKVKRGYLDLLAGEDLDISDILVRTSVPSLAVLPCGQPVEETTELFASSRMNELMEDLAARYSDRIIIIDTPPALASSETNALAMLAGQVVMVVESGKTPRDQLEEALALLTPCENIYCVLNKASETDLPNRYASYPEYYSMSSSKR